MNFYKCPLCYDAPPLCQCTDGELSEHNYRIEQDKEKHRQNLRKEYHKSLDITLDKLESNFGILEDVPLAFLKEYLNKIDKPTWEKIMLHFNEKFKI